jgi:hypothetical protein
MMPQPHEYHTNILEKGILLPELHYGVFARNWWIQKAKEARQKVHMTEEIIIFYN